MDKKIVFCFCIVTVNDIFAASFRRNKQESYSTAVEPGFDLNEEDMTKFHVWPMGNIPYYIDDFSFDKVLRDKIRMFLSEVNRLTSLNFIEIPRPPEDDNARWVLFVNRKGMLDCADHPFYNFTNAGVQKVVLGYNCLSSDENLAGIILSLVGVPPQHNCPDRDKVVTIKENNILPDKLYLFEKLKDNEWLFHNLKYDVESAGHFGPYKYTSNGKITVQQRDSDYHISLPYKEKGFSSNDILKISMLYNFIVRNRETPVPECSKLFVPGSKLTGNIPEDTNLETEPRKKPKRYQGISETEQVSDNNSNNKDEMDEDSETNIVDNYNESNDYNKNENNDYEGNEETIELNENKNNDYEGNEDNIEINENENNDYEENQENIELNENENNDYEGNEENIELNEKEDVDNNDDEDTNYEDNENDDSSNHKEVKENDYGSTKNNNNDNKIHSDELNVNENNITEEKSNEDMENEIQPSKNSETTHDVTAADRIDVVTPRNRLAIKISQSKKDKLLGQSDYETGDEGSNKYIHEKTL